MRTECIEHRSAFYCGALSQKTVSVRLKTAKDIRAATLLADDPYTGGTSPSDRWEAKPRAMKIEAELRDHLIWKCVVECEWRRLQYYFRVEDSDGASLFVLENGFYSPEEFRAYGGLHQFFRFPWINDSDASLPPAWAADTVWCQIMPDRFCMKMDPAQKTRTLRPWGDDENLSHFDFFGGDLPGITSRLEYLRGLGFSGIYLTPVFASSSYHRYNTDDYGKIDPDLGTSEDMRTLVQKAHALGMRVMLDAVFNHCGLDFFAWRDVVEKGASSRYSKWFFVNKWPVEKSYRDTRDGRYYSFAFVGGMPKLNTDNQEVREYLAGLCAAWIRDWDIDGIRFDVGNEVSHAFLRGLSEKLKAQKPDIFLLGEIWHDSFQWLSGGEYDSVMHYPFFASLCEFWAVPQKTRRDLMFEMNRAMTMYRDGLAHSLFTFIDTHDTLRAASRCKSPVAMLQQLAFLLTMPGSPCLFYGTELPLYGADDLQCRKCMPWEKIDAGEFRAFSDEVKKLIALRNSLPELRKGEVEWDAEGEESRVVRYARSLPDASPVRVVLNVSEDGTLVPAKNGADEILYARLFSLESGTLAPGGILIFRAAE